MKPWREVIYGRPKDKSQQVVIAAVFSFIAAMVIFYILGSATRDPFRDALPVGTALVLNVVGLVLLLSNLYVGMRANELKGKIARKWYQLGSDVYYLTRLNTALMEELKDKDSVEIFESPVDPPYVSTLRSWDKS
jgi:hypothetical protein